MEHFDDFPKYKNWQKRRIFFFLTEQWNPTRRKENVLIYSNDEIEEKRNISNKKKVFTSPKEWRECSIFITFPAKTLLFPSFIQLGNTVKC